jgi:NADP-dependent 3-hydroxy acid dehydrogenase YdfG
MRLPSRFEPPVALSEQAELVETVFFLIFRDPADRHSSHVQGGTTMRTVLVTGATRSPGRIIAAELAKAGLCTYALGRDRIALDEMRADHGVVPLAMDLTDRDELRAVAEEIRFDALVHAALRWPESAAFLEASEADIDMALEVNLSAMAQLTHMVLPSMIRNRSGDIVVLGARNQHATSLVEKTVGAALSAFVAGLRSEVAPHGVSVEEQELTQTPIDTMAREIAARLAKRPVEPDEVRQTTPSDAAGTLNHHKDLKS